MKNVKTLHGTNRKFTAIFGEIFQVPLTKLIANSCVKKDSNINHLRIFTIILK